MGAFATIDKWFNGTSQLTNKTKGFCGVKKSVGVRYGGHRHSNANNNIKKSMQAMTKGGKKIPQVMVKVTGGGKGTDKTQKHVNYIGRNGELTVYDQDGCEYKGKSQKELLKTWQAMGVNDKDKEGRVHESHNIVFSMPKGTPPKDLLKAVQELAEQEFKGHNYFLAQHLDTDSPHCHLIISATDDRGSRLLITKADLHNYRVALVNKLSEFGIEAVTSHRIHHYEHRFNKEQYTYHTQDKEQAEPKTITETAQEKIDRIFQKVTQTYIDCLKDDETPKDIKPFIKDMLESRGVQFKNGRVIQQVNTIAKDMANKDKPSLLVVENIANKAKKITPRDTTVKWLQDKPLEQPKEQEQSIQGDNVQSTDNKSTDKAMVTADNVEQTVKVEKAKPVDRGMER